MGSTSNIEWTDATWNPVEGCSMAKGSEKGGCLNCYAARTALRRPASGLAVMRDSGPRWTGKVGLVEKHLADPLHWRAPKRIFVNSMSDLFHESLPDEAIDRVFAVMALCPQHTFQVLTKRPERMRKYLNTLQRIAIPGGHSIAEQTPLPNVWLGVSVEDQKTADERIPLLLQTPAAVRFVSYEPALGPVDFIRYLLPHWTPQFGADQPPWLNLVIVGGESGPGARPFDIDWARNTIAQCKAAGVACFVKQLGADPYEIVSHADYDFEPKDVILKDRKGGDMSEWPHDIRVREMPA